MRHDVSATDMIAMIGAGAVQTPRGQPMAVVRRRVSMSGTKAAQRGVYSVHRGECRPSGCGRSARTSPMLGTKPSTGGVGGEWWPAWTSFPCLERNPLRGTFIRSTGANAAYWPTGGRGESHSPETSVQSPIPAFGRMPPVLPNSGIPLDGNRLYSLVTRIHPPIKGKDLKKRLSPKSPNTLIHSCITFYKTLIFQYLSLWKSVFSPN